MKHYKSSDTLSSHKYLQPIKRSHGLHMDYTGTSCSTLMTSRFKFWHSTQNTHESIQDWEVRVRQSGNLCEYEASANEMCRDKFLSEDVAEITGRDRPFAAEDRQIYGREQPKRYHNTTSRDDPCRFCASAQKRKSILSSMGEHL